MGMKPVPANAAVNYIAIYYFRKFIDYKVMSFDSNPHKQLEILYHFGRAALANSAMASTRGASANQASITYLNPRRWLVLATPAPAYSRHATPTQTTQRIMRSSMKIAT